MSTVIGDSILTRNIEDNYSMALKPNQFALHKFIAYSSNETLVKPHLFYLFTNPRIYIVRKKSSAGLSSWTKYS